MFILFSARHFLSQTHFDLMKAYEKLNFLSRSAIYKNIDFVFQSKSKLEILSAHNHSYVMFFKGLALIP